MPNEAFASVDAVVDLLANSTSPAASPAARQLLQQMSSSRWRVIRGNHRSSADPTPHVTIEVGGTRYHLRLDGRSCVFDITHVSSDETQRLAGRKPWQGPGE
ncbi:MAG: hypothetical protein KDB00_07560 [Planctomycetales bacterium]|nr:hypothetical protein [Planctomycetales bacterium]